MTFAAAIDQIFIITIITMKMIVYGCINSMRRNSPGIIRNCYLSRYYMTWKVTQAACTTTSYVNVVSVTPSTPCLAKRSQHRQRARGMSASVNVDAETRVRGDVSRESVSLLFR